MKRKNSGIVWTVEAILATTIIVTGLILYVQIVSLKTASVSEHRSDLEEAANKMLGALNERGDLDNLICREEYTSPDEALGLIASVAPPGIAVNFTVVKLMRSSNGVVEVDHKIFSIVWGAFDPTRSYSAGTLSLTCSNDKVVILAVSRG
jgi:hypothetical protein